MRFHVVYDSPTPVRRRHLAGADAKDRYAIIRLVDMAGSNQVPTSRILLLRPDFTPAIV